MNAAAELRIAVCFAGKIRTFWWCKGSIIANVLKRLPGKVDIFVNTVDEAGAEIVQTLNPRKAIVETQPEIDERDYWDFMGKGSYPVPGVLQQLRSVAQANSLKQAAESEDGRLYDWVIRIRPDLLFHRPIEDLSLCNRSAIYIPKFSNYWGLNDQFAFGSSACMDLYCSRHLHIEECLLAGHPFHPETLLSWWLATNSVPVARTEIVYSIAREDGLHTGPFLVTEDDVRAHEKLGGVCVG